MLFPIVGRLIGGLEGDALFRSLVAYRIFGPPEMQTDDTRWRVLLSLLAKLFDVAASPVVT